jgi:hypothetical protein
MTGRLLGVIVLLVSNALAAAANSAALPSPSAANTAASTGSVLLVRVVDAASDTPLPNAEVVDVDAGTRRFTNGDGEARISWPERGRLRLRVRQLGFQFEDREVARPVGGTLASTP